MHICRNNQCPVRGRKWKNRTEMRVIEETINAPSGDGNGRESIQYMGVNETINAPSGDGNRRSPSSISTTFRNNQCPVRGRKYRRKIYCCKNLGNNQCPVRGRKSLHGQRLVRPPTETINAPSGDGNAVPNLSKTAARRETINAPSGDGNLRFSLHLL